MKQRIYLLVFIFLTLKAYAQDFPDFSTPSDEEWQFKECVFDKDAAAVVLIDEAFSYSEDDLHLITSRHVRIKILKQSGSKVANITIPFIRFENYERIINLEAVTLTRNENGKIEKTKVDKKSIYTNKINDLIGEINFAFPAVTTGSILEYQYKSVRGNYFGLQDWVFQREIPVLTSRYHLKMIYSKSFSYRMVQNPETETTILPGKDNIFVEMRKIPALTAEPYMDCKNDYLQRINFRVNGFDSRWGTGQVGILGSTWPLLNAQLLYGSHYLQKIIMPVPAANSFTDSLTNEPDEIKKMQFIYNLVRNRMSWNKGNSISADNPDKIWEKKEGDNADINMLLVNLLNRVKLKAYPLLVSKRYNGRVDTTYAYSEQFNALMACVIIKDRKYILDATDTNNLGNLPPVNVLNTNAFLVDHLKGELVKITSGNASYNEDIHLSLEVTDEGQLSGNAIIYNKDYARLEKLKQINSDSASLKDRYPEQVAISDYTLAFEAPDSSVLVEKIAFTAPLYGSGTYSFIPLNLFSSYISNPFVAEKRYSDINFGYNKTLTIKGDIKLPAKYEIDGLPENVDLNFPAAGIHFTRTGTINKTDNSCHFEMNITRNKSEFGTEEYTALRDAFRSIFNKIAEQAVLKKK